MKKMDKALIKEVAYSHEKKAVIISFTDGSKYGEYGETAIKTMAQLNDNEVPFIDIDEKKLK
jgi:hypothetical protein